MALTSMHEVLLVADDTTVELEGRYEPYEPEPFAPPGREKVCVRIMLQHGGGVLLGAYATTECVRPADERERCAGKLVRASGRFFRTRPFPGEGPVPGIWHGGGPQLVGVRVEPIE